MKFLCLHGMGTNSAIFEAQLGPLCSRLEAEGHEFIFVDGITECETSAGMVDSIAPSNVDRS
jgi:hypothetical protein